MTARIVRTTTFLTSSASAKRRTYLLPSLTFLAMGCLLHIFAYQSLEPVVIWRAVYDAFAFIGFEKGRYLGVLVNVTSVAFSCVLAVKIALRQTETLRGWSPRYLCGAS